MQSAVSSQTQNKEQTSTALEQVQKTGHLAKPAPLTLNEIRELGDIFFTSGMFEDVKNVAQAMVKIKAGEELGFTPFVSMGGVHVIKGKPSLGATLQASLLKDSPRYRYETKRIDNEACTLAFYERIDGQWKAIGDSTFTMADAKEAGLTGGNNDMYKKYSRNMLFARALTNGMRWYTPDLLRCADGYSEGDAEFDIDEVVRDTSEPAGTADVQHVDAVIIEDAVDGEIVDEKSPEERRAEKVEHILQLCKWLNEHKDSIAWTKATLTEFVNHKYDVTDGVSALAFKELDEIIAELTERLDAFTKKAAE